VDRAKFHRLDGGLDARIIGHHHHWQVGRLLTDPAQGLEAVPAGPHAQIEQHRIGFLPGKPFYPLLTADGMVNDKNRLAQQGEIMGELSVVINQQQSQPVAHFLSS